MIQRMRAVAGAAAGGFSGQCATTAIALEFGQTNDQIVKAGSTTLKDFMWMWVKCRTSRVSVIRAWNKLDSFKGQAQFGTWLHRLAVNHVLSRRETQRKREARQAGGDGLLARVMAPTRRSSGHAMDIENAMKQLPTRAKDVFVMYDVEGYSHDEIAETLGVSVGTSKSQLHRARMLMRKHLG